MSEEISTLSTASAPAQRTNPHDIRNADLVSRFLAATPPYLYSPPSGPHNFFFSEMLRSLVQARANEQTARNLSQLNRQSRKRAWNRFSHEPPAPPPPPPPHPKTAMMKDMKESSMEKSATDKPLELTNKLMGFPSPAAPSKVAKDSANLKVNMPSNEVVEKKPHVAGANGSCEAMASESATLPSSDLVLPPPPPMWYPPLCPPYGIDPLHFFIDLRVSAAGHIYDRKKESPSPVNDNNNTTTPAKHDVREAIGKPRHGSAFSVPAPRRDKSPLALNLTATPGVDRNALANYRQSLLLMDAEKEAVLNNAKNTNYVLPNLPRIYTTMMPPPASGNSDDRQSVLSDASDSKSDSDLHDIEVKDEDRDYSNSDDVVIVDCQDMDDNHNNNSKHISY